MAYVPNSGSVVSFQSNPSVLQTLTGLMSTNASVITTGTAVVNNGSVVAFQGGTWNINASLVGVSPVNIVGGSIAASFTPPANQSVSGTVQTDVRGSVATVIIGGSIAASFTPPANQSVSGTVGASLIGLSPVSVSNFPTNQNVSGSVVAFVNGTVPVNAAGSVVAFQGTSPWIITGSVQAELTPAANQSVSGTVGASLIGLSPVSVSNFPATQNISGSVIAFPVGNQSISGTVNVGTGGPVSVLGTMSVLGTVPVTQATTPWVIGSVYGNMSGSVAAFQLGTWRTSVQGSVTALQGTNPWTIVWPAPSIVGTYAEDAAHTTADRGLFTLAVRNDTVASFAGANTEYSPNAVDSAGRNLIKPFAPDQARAFGTASTVGTSVTAVLAAAGTGLRNYITDINVSNTGAATTLVQFTDSNASVIGMTIAPTGGGSNINGLNMPWRTGSLNSQVDMRVVTPSSLIYVTMSGYIAP